MLQVKQTLFLCKVLVQWAASDVDHVSYCIRLNIHKELEQNLHLIIGEMYLAISNFCNPFGE